MKSKIESEAQQEMTDAQRQYYLRQQLKAIQDELGEGEKPESQELRKRLNEAKLPEAVTQIAQRELDRLESGCRPLPPILGSIRTYFDWVLDIPWSTVTDDRLDPIAARAALDQDHYDLDKVKERIVEYLAVQKLKARRSGLGPDQGPDSLLRRPARRRQNIAWTVDRARDEPQVRPDFARRGPGRGGDSRPSPAPTSARSPGRIVQALETGRRDESGVHAFDEIDKVTARRLSGRSLRRAARSTRSGAEPFLPAITTTSRSTSICPASCSSRRRTSSGRFTRRYSIGWKSSRSSGIPRKTRFTLPVSTVDSAPARRNGLAATQLTIDDDAVRRHHHAVHARSRRPQPRAAANRCGDAKRSPRAWLLPPTTAARRSSTPRTCPSTSARRKPTTRSRFVCRDPASRPTSPDGGVVATSSSSKRACCRRGTGRSLLPVSSAT